MYWSSFAIVSFILGIIALITVKWWFICFPCAILSIVVIIWGHKLGGKSMNIFGITTSLLAIALYIILAAFSYVDLVSKEVNNFNEDSLKERLEILSKPDANKKP